jgi:hypothetical protein
MEHPLSGPLGPSVLAFLAYGLAIGLLVVLSFAGAVTYVRLVLVRWWTESVRERPYDSLAAEDQR